MQEKGSVYSGSSVSLMVKRGPGLAPGTTVDVHGLQADRASSFAESATASVPDFVDSRSLVSILAGNPARTDWRQVVLIEHAESELDATGRKPGWVALRGSDFLYTLNNTGEQEQYDLRVDPAEAGNFAATSSGTTLAALTTRAAQMQTCKAGAFRSI